MMRANHVLAYVGQSDKIVPDGLESFRQFIDWKPVPSKTVLGKVDKIPCDPRGDRIDAHDSKHWRHAGEVTRPAFVLTENDDFFCIDLDDAWNGSAWSPLALDIFAMFPGAGFEISHSGKGAHFFGRGAASIPADHKIKNKDVPGLEFYTRWRFIALTGTSKAGSAAVDFSAVLPALVARYGLERPPVAPSGPRAPSLVPLPADAEIIRKACDGRGSLKATFGVHFRDLWRSNDARLAAEWPASGRTDKCPFDRSSADASLLTHLAFWTNGDEGAMDRLFRQSDLMRPKWDEANYRGKTMAFVKSRWNGVGYTGAPPALPATAASRIEATVEAANAAIGSVGYLSTSAQEKLFAGCVYIENRHLVLMPDGRLLAPANFRSAFGGGEFQMQPDNARPTRNAFEAFTENRMRQFPKAADICFRPSEAPGAILPGRLVNIWRAPVIDEAYGDVAPFLDLLERMYTTESDRKILLTYMQSATQNVGVKFQWAPVIQGTQGGGKTLLIKAMRHAIGDHHFYIPKASRLGEKFNGYIEGKTFIAVEEIKIAEHRREIVEFMKDMITNDRIEVRHVGGHTSMVDNFANWMFTTNHQDAIPVDQNQRRFAILFAEQQRASDLQRWYMGGDYFPRLYHWFEHGGGKQAIAWFLRHSPIDPEFDPAGMCQRAPATSSSSKAIMASMGRIEQFIIEAIEGERQGFRGGWISGGAVDMLMIEKKMNTVGPHRKADILAALDYVSIGRSTKIIPFQGDAKPQLYRYLTPKAIGEEMGGLTNQYMLANGYTERTEQDGRKDGRT